MTKIINFASQKEGLSRIMHRPPLDKGTTDGIPICSLSYDHAAKEGLKQCVKKF